MRTLQVTGNVVADAERKISKAGKEYLAFRIANNEFNDDKDEQGKQKPYWIRVTSWNQRHFAMAQYLTKGKPVIVIGDYSDNIYQTKDGTCEISRDIVANAIYFNSTSSGENGGQVNKPTTQPSPTTQTVMEAPKLTTAEVKVPSKPAVSDDEDDDLPF